MKKGLIAVSLAMILLLVGVAPVMAIDNEGAETCSWACTEVVKCPEGYGKAVFHINGHCVALPNDGCKFDLHIQGTILIKPDGGKNEVIHFQKHLVWNGQAGEDGVFNGQCMFSVNGAGEDGYKFHLIWHYANGEWWCKVVPVGAA